MKPQVFAPALTDAQRQRCQRGLRSPDAFTVRRCQILLASSGGAAPSAIARQLGCTARTVRNAIHAFTHEGLDCLKEKSSRPHSARPFLGAAYTEALKELLHHSPRTLGQPTSLWTLDLVAEVCHGRGWTPRPLTGEAVRVALKRLGIRWRRAKHWITSPDPAYARKKKPATA
jgi:transposase